MAIGYSNATRHMPTSGTRAGSTGNLGQGDPVNGYPFGSTTPGYIDYRDPSVNGAFYPGTTRQQYNDDPNARKLHSPGSSRGEQSGFKPPTPSQGGPVGTPESDAAWEEMRQRTEREAFARRGMPFSNMQEWKDSDPQYVALRDAFKNATDPRAKAQALKAANDYDTRRQMQFKSDNARNAFIAQGGQGSTWDNRFSNENNWPRPTSSIGYSHGPGRPDYATRGTNPSPYGDTRFTNPPPPGVAPPGASQVTGGGGIGGVAGPAKAGGTGMSYGSYGGGGAAPSGGGGNMMIASQGGGGGYGQYLGGGGNMGGGNMMVSQGGGGGYGQYLGGGGNMGGGNMMIASQGGGGGYGQYLGGGGNMGGGNMMVSQGGGGGYGQYLGGGGGNMGGGVGTSFAINNPFAFNGGMTMGGGNPFASMGGGETGMMYPGGGMPQGGNPFGGYSRPGYSPFDSGNYSMPYDNGGMWQMFGGSPMGGGRGMNYAQMQNYLGLQPQGAPNWIGL